MFVLSSQEDDHIVVYYESIKRDLKTKPIHWVPGELEHLKIEMRLIDEIDRDVFECDG
jgi:hypothetical protein